MKRSHGYYRIGDRKDALDELFNTIASSVDAIRNGETKYTAEQINKAVDLMVDRVFDDGPMDDFEDIVFTCAGTSIKVNSL